MAFPSTQASVPSLREAYDDVTAYAGAIKQRATSLNNQSAAGPVDGGVLINFLRDLVAAKARLAARVSTPGLPAYAKTQRNDQALDIAADYTAMVAQITATITWLQSNFPKDGSGYLLYEQVGGDGTVSYRAFTTAQLATLRTQLAALSNTIS